MGATKKKKESSAGSPEQRETHEFCAHKMVRYVKGGTTWPAFRDGTNALLSFHAAKLPPEALATEIELFATRLDKYLLAVGFAGKEGARYATRSTVARPEDPMTKLLDAVDENYRQL